MKKLRLRIEFPEGTKKEKISEILKRNNFREMKIDGSFRRNIYIKILIRVPINFHCFCREDRKEENNKISLFCHVDYKYRVNDETRQTWVISSGGRMNQGFIEKFAKELTKVIKEVIRTNWEEIKKEIEKEIERESRFKK